MKLVYFSPVRWESPKQRSHAFVEWFHEQSQSQIVWIEPSILRYPKIKDLGNLGLHYRKIESTKPEWLEQVTIDGLPLEPFFFYEKVMHRTWKRQLAALESAGTVVVCAIPSKLALFFSTLNPKLDVIADLMDDFPSFHSGTASKSIERVQKKLLRRAQAITYTSRGLEKYIHQSSSVKELVPNASWGIRPGVHSPQETQQKRAKYVYLGTVAEWFDWDFLLQLAQKIDSEMITIIGPIYKKPSSLPSNIHLIGPLPHDEAMILLAEHEVGLIPFISNELTSSVDPIKFYEYRDAGLITLASDFVGMRSHQNEPDLITYSDNQSIEDIVSKVDMALSGFAGNLASITWAQRFSHSKIYEELVKQFLERRY